MKSFRVLSTGGESTNSHRGPENTKASRMVALRAEIKLLRDAESKVRAKAKVREYSA
jgi:hypothetical protein